MTDIGNTDDEYDGGNGSGGHDGPDRPFKEAAGAGDTEESHGDAALDNGGAGGVKELGDEEELWVAVSFALIDFQIEEGEITHLGSTHPFTGSQGGSKLASSVKAADNA